MEKLEGVDRRDWIGLDMQAREVVRLEKDFGSDGIFNKAGCRVQMET